MCSQIPRLKSATLIIKIKSWVSVVSQSRNHEKQMYRRIDYAFKVLVQSQIFNAS